MNVVPVPGMTLDFEKVIKVVTYALLKGYISPEELMSRMEKEGLETSSQAVWEVSTLMAAYVLADRNARGPGRLLDMVVCYPAGVMVCACGYTLDESRELRLGDFSCCGNPYHDALLVATPLGYIYVPTSSAERLLDIVPQEGV